MEPILPGEAARGDIVVLGVPADDKSSFMRGAAKAPGAIREALATSSWNLFAEDGLDLGACERLKDAGDLALGGRLDLGAVEGAAATLLSRGARLVGLGGDHSVSLPLLRAQAAAGGPLAVLHFDAHPDLYEAFEGDRFSHACPFARALEEGLLTRLVQVGIRGMNAHQRAQARRYGVEVIDMAAFAAGERPAFDGPFYLSFDIDALDPAFAPGVSHREPGGLSTREAISLIATTSGKLVGADLVELNPSRDWEGLTALTAAKLLKELLARMVRDSE